MDNNQYIIQYIIIYSYINKSSKTITIPSRNVPWIFHFTRGSVSNETQDIYAALGWYKIADISYCTNKICTCNLYTYLLGFSFKVAYKKNVKNK